MVGRHDTLIEGHARHDSGTRCTRCVARERRGPRTTPLPPTECVSCNKPMVPMRAPKEEGKVRHQGRGLCISCYRRQRRAGFPSEAASV